MYEDSHLEAYYESRQHGDMDYDSIEDDWDWDEFTDDELGFDDDDYDDDEIENEFCGIHSEHHIPGGFLCELKSTETFGGTD